MRNYNTELAAVADLPKVALGEEVDTPIGRGIIVSMEMPFNGLYLSPQKAIAVVWFSTTDSINGWVSREFRLPELKKIITIENKISRIKGKL